MSQKDKERFIGAVEYPAKKEDIAAAAEANDAPPELVEKIRNLSDGEGEFSGPQDVFATLQGLPRVRVPK